MISPAYKSGHFGYVFNKILAIFCEEICRNLDTDDAE